MVFMLSTREVEKSWNLRKFYLWPTITGWNIDLGSKIIPPIASTRREQSALRRFVWKRQRGGSHPPPLLHRRRWQNTVYGRGLTRAPLGYFYNAPHWGGGAISSPPLISETTGPILKIQAAFESPGKTVEGKQILLTSGSRVTSQVRSKSKCSTFRAWWHRRAKLRC